MQLSQYNYSYTKVVWLAMSQKLDSHTLQAIALTRHQKLTPFPLRNTLLPNGEAHLGSLKGPSLRFMNTGIGS